MFKKNVFTAVALLTAFLATAQMEFVHDLKWAKVLEKANTEKKNIFVDCYTTWCGPCKMMSRDIFPDKEVGEYYNANYINVKMDMEKEEGIALGQMQSVQAYPTYLFFDSEGNLLHRGVGYIPASQFLQLGKDALDPTKQIARLDQQYEQGNRDSEFLYNYAYTLYNASDMRSESVAEEYLAKQADMSSEKNMTLIMDMIRDTESKGFQYLTDNKAKFEEGFGAERVDNAITQGLYRKSVFSLQAADGNLNDSELLPIYEKALGKNGAKRYDEFKLEYYANIESWNDYFTTAEHYVNSYKIEEWNTLNSLAWAMYEASDDKKQLTKALAWANKSVSKSPNYYNHDTAAALYYKLGKKKQARKNAKKAIELAKKDGMSQEEYQATLDLLEKIQ